MAKNESLKIVEHEQNDRNEDQEDHEKKVFVGHGDKKQDLKELLKNDASANQLDFFVKNRNTGCYVYRFDLEDLELLYNDPDFLFVFKNGLQSLWLSYLTTYIITQNENLSQYFKQFESDSHGLLKEEQIKIEKLLNSLQDVETKHALEKLLTRH